MTNCGAGGSGAESCCTSLGVDGGTFYRQYTYSGDSGPQGEDYQATVSGFRLDKYIVTVGRFRQFVNAWNNGSGWTPQSGAGKHTHLNGGQGLLMSAADAGAVYEPGWVVTDNVHISPTDANLTTTNCDIPSVFPTWTATPGAQENLPMNCVNWWEAYAFCIWDGGFLPSEAEWEYTAAGGNEQREYPWGSMNPGTNNQYAIYGCNYPNASGKCTSAASIAPVGTASLGAGKWGQLDLSGEMFQWTVDGNGFYDPCVDCAYVGTTHLTNGGDFHFVLFSPWNYSPFQAPSRDDVGIRCARVP
jgi:formylglycine-generating enzyme required for sulfatase activity